MSRLFIASLLLAGLCCVAPAADARTPSFTTWKQGFAAKLRSQGFAPSAIELFLASAHYVDIPVRAQKRQPERTASFSSYRHNLITEARVEQGRALLRDYRAYFDLLSANYGIEAELFVALWGVETSYGRSMGRHQVIAALASLAYAGERRAFFEKQLVAAVKMAATGDVPVERMTGSWAGAMGHYQFIPTTLESFGIDGDGDRRLDVWGSYADAAASAGNYLKKIGWHLGDLQIRAVDAQKAKPLLRKEKAARMLPANHWKKAGLLAADCCDDQLPLKLVTPDKGRSGYYLVGAGFDKLREWNRSSYFALAVLLLAEQLATPAGPVD